MTKTEIRVQLGALRHQRRVLNRHLRQAQDVVDKKQKAIDRASAMLVAIADKIAALQGEL